MADQSISKNSLNIGLLDTVTDTEFFTNYWEKQPLHIARSKENPFESLINLDAIENLLSTNDLYYPAVQLSHAGQTVSAEEYTDEHNKIVSGRLLEHFYSGSTIVLTHMHKLNTNLMSLCRDVQRQYMMRCQTNVYLSPAGNQGFNPHFDTHDVFILQVSGSKTFNFYSGGSSFPTSADKFNSEIHDIGSQTESIALSAGDTLYIPRGFTHDALASDDEPSLHITLGVYPILLHDLLQELVHICTGSEVEMRKSVSQAAWMAAEPATPSLEPIVDKLSTILQQHVNENSVSLALSRLRDGMALEASKDCQQLISRVQNKSIHLNSRLRVNHESILQSERTGGTLKVRTFGAIVEFNDPLIKPVEWLLSQSECGVEAMPEMNSTERDALLDTLREYHIITVF